MKPDEQSLHNDNDAEKIIVSLPVKSLDEEKFWHIMDASLKGMQGRKYQLSKLESSIEDLSANEIVGFKIRLIELERQLYTSDMWCAATLLNQGYASEDTFEYFRYWVVSRGKNVCEAAMKDPDSLVSEYVGSKRDYDFEHLAYVPNEVFQLNFGMDIYGFLPQGYFTLLPELDHNWQRDDLLSMARICPKLYEAVYSEQILKKPNHNREMAPEKNRKGPIL